MKLRFKLKDISIKNRMTLSNLTIILVAAIFVACSLTTVLMSLIYTFDGKQINVNLTDSLGFVSVYQLQIYVNNLEEALLEGEPEVLVEDSYINSMCNQVEKTGAVISIVLNEHQIYRTPGYTRSHMQQLARDVTQSDEPNIDQPMFYTSEKGSILVSLRQRPDNSTMRIVLVNTSLNEIVGNTREETSRNFWVYFSDLLFWIALIAVGVIILINVLLSVTVSRTFLLPLKKLTQATHEIRDGNLDSELNYSSLDEIGQLCADFEEMRQRLDESVKARQRYEDGRQEMIAGISHDLGTPLTSIKGYVSGLIDGIADTPEKQAHYLRTIYNAACDMDELVSELSLLSRLGMDRVPFYFDKVDMCAFFADNWQELEPRFVQEDIELLFENFCAAPVYCSVDRMQMRRVVLNILGNCVKYKRQEGGRVRIVLRCDETDLLAVIADNGVGVGKEDLSRIFDSFYRTDRARSSLRKGNGLGLAITRQIVERHSGRIWAQGSRETGLAIFIALPRIVSHTQQEEENHDGQDNTDH